MKSRSQHPRQDAGYLMNLLEDLRQRALALGFLAMGAARPGPPPFWPQFETYLAAGRHGGMAWLARHRALRFDPRQLLEGCRTILTLAYPYSAGKPATPEGYMAARFTDPVRPDYHRRLRELVRPLMDHLRRGFPGSRFRVCVDSAPVLERSWAYASGLGFIGKNTQIIRPGHGSYLYLMEILTTATLPVKAVRAQPNRCGSCRNCLEACPTGALQQPYTLDASRCLSYLSIEYAGPLTAPTAQKMGRCFYGCDVCQEVCPFNVPVPAPPPVLPPADHLAGLSEDEFQQVWGHSAFARAGLGRLKRNLAAIRSQGQPGGPFASS